MTARVRPFAIFYGRLDYQKKRAPVGINGWIILGLIAGMSGVLPALVDKLTPQGRLPTAAELAGMR